MLETASKLLQQAVAKLLQQVLGSFIKGIDTESLRLSVWHGDIRLTDLELDVGAVEGLGLPLRVLRGSVREVRVEVPWRHLSTRPIVVSVEQLHILVAPKGDAGTWDPVAEEKHKLQAKREQLEVWGAMEIEKGAWDAMGERMVAQLVQDLLRKLVLEVSDLHVQLESGEDRSVIVAGLTLQKLSVANLPDLEVSPKGLGSKARILRKTVSIDGLGLYLEPPQPILGNRPQPPGPKDRSSPKMMGGMDESSSSHCPPHAHLVRPISLQLDAWINPSTAHLDSSSSSPQLELRFEFRQPVWVTVQRPQLVAIIALAEDIGRTERIDALRQFGRPGAPPSTVGARAWWVYARRATMVLHHSARMRFTWAALVTKKTQRLAYVNAYLEMLTAQGKERKLELKQRLAVLEDELELDDIIRYRKLACARASLDAEADANTFRWFWEKNGAGGAALSHADIRKLQMHCDASASGPGTLKSGNEFPEGYVQLRVHADLRGVNLRLASMEREPIAQLALHSLAVGFSVRPREEGIGLQLRVESLSMTDLETPWPQLRTLVCAHAPPCARARDASRVPHEAAEEADWKQQQPQQTPSRSAAPLLAISLETEPVGVDAALDFACELQPLSLLINPRLVASLVRFIQVPPSHWQANIGMEQARQAVADTIKQLQLEAERRLRGRAVRIRLRAHAPSLLVVEPPPTPTPLDAAAWRAHEDFLICQVEDATRPIDASHQGAASLAGSAASTAPIDASHSSEQPTLLGEGSLAPVAGSAAPLASADDAQSARDTPMATVSAARPPLLELRVLHLRLGALRISSSDGSSDSLAEDATRSEPGISTLQQPLFADPSPHIPQMAEASPHLALTISLRGVIAALLPPTDAAAMLRASAEATTAEVAAKDGNHFGAGRYELLAPIDASFRMCQRMEPAPRSEASRAPPSESDVSQRYIPALDGHLDLSAVRFRVTEAQLVAVTSLGLSILSSVLPALDETNQSVRSGFLTLYASSGFAGRTQLDSLGVCWVALQRDALVYTRRGGIGGLCSVDLSRHMLMQAITRQSHGNHTAIAWQSHGNHTAITWQSHGNHTAITRQSHGNHTAITRRSHGDHTVIIPHAFTPPACGQHRRPHHRWPFPVVSRRRLERRPRP